MSTKIIAKFPACKHSSWTAVVNSIEKKLESGECTVPVFPGPTKGMMTPCGQIPSGVGLFDTNGRLVLHCNDGASATVWSRFINEKFAEK